MDKNLQHYQEKVFPNIEHGKTVFNWWACIFGVYWLPYKGLWSQWAIFLIPYGIIYGIFLNTKYKDVIGLLGLGVAIAIGFTANKFYCKAYKASTSSNIPMKQNVVSGISATIIYIVLIVLVSAFIGKGSSNQQEAIQANNSIQQATEETNNPLDKYADFISKNYGFQKESIETYGDEQRVVSKVIPDVVTFACGFRYKDANGQMAKSGKLEINGSKQLKVDNAVIKNMSQEKQNEIFINWFTCLRVLDESIADKVVKTYLNVATTNTEAAWGELLNGKVIDNYMFRVMTSGDDTTWVLKEN